jgi:hypothetical protein
VVWSNLGNESGIQSIVPAVPSTTGVAEVFALQGDGTVAAITSAVQQNGVWSNSLSFIVPVSGGGASNTITPAMLNVVVGDTHTIQALSTAGQPVTGLTWTSSNPSVVSLSTDNPPILTAVAAGHVTNPEAEAFGPPRSAWRRPIRLRARESDALHRRSITPAW